MQDIMTTLADMSTREKVCQMVMGQFWGTELTSDFECFLQTYPLGAYRLAGWNIQSSEQVRLFTDQVRNVFAQKGFSEPILASDEEGGTLSVFRDIIPSFPGTMALGATGSGALVRRQMRSIASFLRHLGISMNFSPVCDVNLNPRNTVVGVRAFGDDAALCGRLALESMYGTNEGGVLNCAKHFPGHGATLTDTHFTLATDDLPLELFEKLELDSFMPCIRTNVDSIFVNHVMYPCIDPKMPASLSYAMITDVLRRQCGYDGVIITDDLNMKAIVDKWGIAQASLMFLQAGGDMAMTCGTPSVVEETIMLLESAVQEGLLLMSRVDQSVARILRMKARLKSFEKNPIQEDMHALSLEIARAAMTCIRDPYNLLPLKKNQRILVVLPKLKNMTLSDTSADIEIHLAQYLKPYCSDVSVEKVPAEPKLEDIKRVLESAKGADYVIQLTYSVLTYPQQAHLFSALAADGNRVLALLIREPYDAIALPEKATVVVSYSAIDESMRAAADALFGLYDMPGKLPVTLK